MRLKNCTERSFVVVVIRGSLLIDQYEVDKCKPVTGTKFIAIMMHRLYFLVLLGTLR